MKNLIFLLLLWLPVTGFSQRVLYGSHILINKPVNEDLYIAGGTVTINAPVHGDLAVAGGTVIINDTVTNDILVAGGNVTLNGVSGDDVRCAGGNIHVQQLIAGDLVITGGTIEISRPAVVEGNLLTGGGEVQLDGTIKGMVRAGSGKLKINGLVEGPLDARAVELNLTGAVKGNTLIAAQKLYVGPHAALLKSVRYWNGNGTADFGAAVKNGQPVFDTSLKMDQPRWHYLGFASFLVLVWYLTTALLFIILIQYFFGRTMQKAGESIPGNVSRFTGVGLLFVALTPVAIIIVFLSLAGIPIALLMLIAYVSLLLLASVIVSVVLANWVNANYEKKRGFWRLVSNALGIFIVLKFISLVPVLGWLINLLVIFLVFGSLLLNIRWPHKIAHRPAPPAVG
ncbi:MAG TPA: hypothetical protein VIM87_17030 [Chitinophaga sp.]|uniref:hypothetical protein n=1 Tax=Chitinophaga sp. TaxID=1869181 RepID=UPI002F9273EA